MLAMWLMEMTRDLVLARVTAHRLRFEAKTWQKMYGMINNQIEKCLTDVGNLKSKLDSWLADSMVGLLTVEMEPETLAECEY